MNKRQLIAFENPCARGKEYDRKFWAREFHDGIVMSTVLTVSRHATFGPAWHVSVALLDERLWVRHLDRISAKKRNALIRTAKRLLDGVGQLPEVLEEFPLAVHYRRALTDKELTLLPKEMVHEENRVSGD
jgi:hypothetical protein